MHRINNFKYELKSSLKFHLPCSDSVIRIILPFILLILFSPASVGATRTWLNSGAGGPWTTAANWGSVIPVNGDDIVITPTANIVITNVPNGLTFNSITINGAFNVTFTGSGTIGMAINNTNSTPALTITTGAALTLGNGTYYRFN